MDLHILQPTSLRREKPGPWALQTDRRVSFRGAQRRNCCHGGERTNNQRDHARAVAASGFEPLDELLDLPYLDLYVMLRVSTRGHGRWGESVGSKKGATEGCTRTFFSASFCACWSDILTKTRRRSDLFNVLVWSRSRSAVGGGRRGMREQILNQTKEKPGW